MSTFVVWMWGANVCMVSYSSWTKRQPLSHTYTHMAPTKSITHTEERPNINTTHDRSTMPWARVRECIRIHNHTYISAFRSESCQPASHSSSQETRMREYASEYTTQFHHKIACFSMVSVVSALLSRMPHISKAWAQNDGDRTCVNVQCVWWEKALDAAVHFTIFASCHCSCDSKWLICNHCAVLHSNLSYSIPKHDEGSEHRNSGEQEYGE